MRILVTGGTGFIGSHSVAALRRDGHRVRLLTHRTRPAADPDTVEQVAGDITAAASVAAALRGCDAVLHAASVYSFDSRDHRAMRAVNVRGTEVVLAAARAAGADPIVHVSSFAALLPGTGRVIGPEAPVGAPREVYMATKAESEIIARRHQADGAPVVISYPPATLGPGDTRLGDQVARLRAVLNGLIPLWPRGGFPIGDVRDVADLHAALFRRGGRPARYLAPGRYVPTGEYLGTLRAVTDRALPAALLPTRLMLPAGALVTAVQRLLPVHVPAEYGAIYLCAQGRPVDCSATDRLLRRTARPLAETMADTVRWLYEAGHVGARRAGAVIRPSAGSRPPR